MLVSAVVCAYNEERNIERMLDSLLDQRTPRGRLLEIVVVASGCTDSTRAIVRERSQRDRRIRLVVQEERDGKASALNCYLRQRDMRAEAILIASADVLLRPGLLDLLLETLGEPNVGMCGGRPIPTNPRRAVMGRVVNLLWDLHHDVCLRAPKLGEAVLVRADLVDCVPDESPVDEASVEARITGQGFELRYVPDAIVANRGPDNLADYFKQRRRIAAGHFWVCRTSGYAVSTLDTRRIVRLALRHLGSSPAANLALVAAAAIEATARALGYLDFRRGRSHAVWSIADSAHQPVDGAPPAPGRAPHG
jgi:poly-beta-1,6-N-acetyl-D-glucosamine synthase